MRRSLATLAAGVAFTQPVVAPGGRRLAFYSSRSGQREIWKLDTDRDELTQVTQGGVPNAASLTLHWGPDSNALYFERACNGGRASNLYRVTLDGALEQLTEFADRRCILREVGPDLVYFTTDTQGEWTLWDYDPETRESTPLSETVWCPPMAGLNPRKDRLAFPAPQDDAKPTRGQPTRNIALMEPSRFDIDVLEIGAASADVVARTWQDDRRLCVTASTRSGTRHGIYDLATNSVSWIATSEYDETPVTYLDSADALLVIRTMEFADRPVVYPLEDEPEVLNLPQGTIDVPRERTSPPLTLPDGGLLFRHSATDTPPQLIAHNLCTNSTDVLLRSWGGDDETSFVAAEEVTYESQDGLEIHGLLYDSGHRPSPAVVRVKGGPGGRNTRRFASFIQHLVGAGYTVFEPNYRGSHGRGREFRELAFTESGTGDVGDVAAAAEWLASQEWIDGDRIGVSGHSHGAYLVYLVLGRYPGLWAAGVAWNGFTDLLALDADHARGHMEWLLGDRTDNMGRWRERSPSTYVEAMEAPLLILHGEADWIPVSQARQLQEHLEACGWTRGEDFEYIELTDQGHRNINPTGTRERWHHIQDFLDTHLHQEDC